MSDPDRRKFLGTAAGVAAFTILPRHVLGGPGYVAPSDKVTLAYIGVGTEGIREMLPLLNVPELQIVAVCDPNQHAAGYRDWSASGILNSVRKTLGKSDWWAGGEGIIPGGRDCAKDIVDTYYGKTGCAAYADFRELLEKEKDLNAVKIMTPDHLHGVIAMAAMKRGKHTITHKPLANRLKEARQVIDTARAKRVATHYMPCDANGDMQPVMDYIHAGAIGTLREIHNWTNRPVWPQYPSLPTDAPPVPQGFNWDLWLGPEAMRPYHPHYTHMVFRGWYDFGGGSMADMGHYSLWSVLNALDLAGPSSVEPMLTHDCAFSENVSTTIRNDFSFPTASVVRFQYPARGQRPAVDLIWYEGGMRPPTPPELDQDRKELPLEGMMFVGDKGKTLAGFNIDNPVLIPEKKGGTPRPVSPRRPDQTQEISPGLRQWIEACKGGAPSPGNFLTAWPITEAVNLYAVALRARKRLLYDAESVKITNLPEANKYLSREYRKGWEPESI